MKIRLITVLLLCLAVTAEADDDRNPELDHLFGLGHPDVFTISSETVGRDFHIYVRLPRAYTDNENEYPVAYLLDGGILFPMLAPYQIMMEIDEIVPEIILVGISYGTPPGYASGNMRATDYTAPADEPESWGGAETYQKFLATELLPRIENEYRADPEKRIILGQSLGGQFVLYTALTRPDLFRGHIAVNPALRRNLGFFLKLTPPDGAPKPRLFIGVASEEREPLRTSLEKWINAHRSGENPLEFHVESLPDQHHASAAPAAYQAGLRWLFGPDADTHAAGDD